MNRQAKVVILLALVVFSSVTLLFAGAPPDPLWKKAIAIADTNSDWVAGLVIIRSQVIYKGETNGVHELWQRSKPGRNGDVVTETVKVLENGKDVTEQETKKEQRRKGKAGGQGSSSPFNPAVQNRLSLTLTNRTRSIEGKDCVGYFFELRDNGKGPTTRGMAWLERETGIPAQLENVTLDPLPDKHLKGMTILTRYESTPDGAWRVKEMRTTGKVSMFFIKADVQSTMTFSEYWKPPRRTKGL